MKVSDQNKVEKHGEVILVGIEYLTKMSKGKYFDEAQEGRYWDIGLQLIDQLRETIAEIEKIGQLYASKEE